MKKIFEKLRIKIIHKLGGYAVDPHEKCSVHVSERKLVTMCSQKIFAHNELEEEGWKEYEQRRLAFQLAEELFESDLFEFRGMKNGDEVTLSAIITVAEPVNYEVNYFLGEET